MLGHMTHSIIARCECTAKQCCAIFDVCDSGGVTMLCLCQAVQAVSAFLDSCCGSDLVVV